MPETITKAQQEQMRQEKLMQQYRDLFGLPPVNGEGDTRTAAQIAVWEDLEIRGYFSRSTMIPDRVGACCQFRMANAEGARCFFLYIRSNVLFRPEIQQAQQQQ